MQKTIQTKLLFITMRILFQIAINIDRRSTSTSTPSIVIITTSVMFIPVTMLIISDFMLITAMIFMIFAFLLEVFFFAIMIITVSMTISSCSLVMAEVFKFLWMTRIFSIITFCIFLLILPILNKTIKKCKYKLHTYYTLYRTHKNKYTLL